MIKFYMVHGVGTAETAAQAKELLSKYAAKDTEYVTIHYMNGETEKVAKEIFIEKYI